MISLPFDLFFATILLWGFFIVTANIIKRYKEGELSTSMKIIGWPVVIAFFLCDMAYNITYGTILFWQWPNYKRLTLTARLTYILRTAPDSWRGKIAMFMCKYMIEPWDAGHCDL